MSVFSRHAFKAVLSLLLTLLLLSACSRTTVPTAPPSLPQARQAVAAYYEDGAWKRDVAAMAEQGRAWIESRLKQGVSRPAVVFDVDETLVSTYPVQKEMGFCFDRAAWDAWVDKAQAPAVESMRQLYVWLQGRGVTLFLITARHEKHRAATKADLLQAEYSGWAELYMRPDDSSLSAREYKTATRQGIEKQGYEIVANFGDQESDLAGGHADKTFKLPNLIYVVQ